MIGEGWASTNQEDNCWGRFNAKVKNCKKALLSWDKANVKNAATEILKLKTKLQRLVNDKRVFNNTDEVRWIRKEMDRLWRQ